MYQGGDPVGDLCRAAIDAIEDLINPPQTQLESQTGVGTQSDTGTDVNAVPVPYPQTKAIPEDYNLRFDITLGIREYLEEFAASFSDYPTVFFYWWPDWMITDSRMFSDSDPELVSSIVIASLRVWAKSSSKGMVKFNLEGLHDVRDDGAIHRTTLRELQKLLASPDLLLITQFYRFDTGTPRLLLDGELAKEIALITPLFGRL